MRRIICISIFLVVSASCSLVGENSSNYGKIEGTYDVEFLNNNADKFEGKTVHVLGYVHSGFDGHHTSCFVSVSKGTTKLEETSWIDNKGCYSESKSLYREGMAVVSGVFSKYKNPVFVGGDVYPSELKGASINWNH